MTPTHFGHYRVEQRIGQGGMGEVFRAFDTRLNRAVAVKVMKEAHGEAVPAVQRFLREARAASALNHPNIVTIHEVSETADGELFIVQEFIDGQTLRAVATGEPLPLTRILDIVRQVSRALAAAHSAGIVHRDVKPENIMVRGDGYVKVLDFGLARVVEIGSSTATTQSEHATAPGTLLGTTSYMAPEQVRVEIAGPPADVFALGIVLYELAAGRRPFVAPTSLGVLAAILSEQPVPLARVNPATPYVIDALVQRMLSKDPERRPSAREIDEELSALQGSDILTAPPIVAATRNTVGRDEERRALRRAFGAAREGRSRILGISGEAGIGKTSLVEDFIAELSTGPDRPTITRGRCSERLAGTEAYLPILEVLDSLLQRATGASVNTVMKALAPTWYLQVAHAAADQGSIARVRDEVAAASQERMKRELGTFFQEVSRSQSVVMFLDDLHWADVSTIDMLNYLAGRFDEMRVLIVATYRPADMALAQHPFLSVRDTLRARGAYEEISLRFLGPEDVERYLATEFPQHNFPTTLATTIHDRTEGNPLFMADLVRYLRDSGTVAEEHGRWVQTRALSKELPESVRSMIVRKVEQLGEQDRRLLVAASVQGYEFDSAIVSEALEMDAAEVEERLEVLERVHVFVTRGREYEFPDLTLTLKYRFVHVLYQNVLYASLQPTRRAMLSGRVAKGLARHQQDQIAPIAGQLAILFEAARDFAASANYFSAAAQHAVSLFAFREALTLAERGLSALRGLPDDAVRKQHELGLQMIRGLALRSMKGWAAAELEPVFARAGELCQQLEDPPELLPVLWAITLFHAIRGDLREYRRRAEDLQQRAEQVGKPELLVGAYHLVGVCREFTGDMLESSRTLDLARELHVPAQHLMYTAMYGLDPGMIARAMSSRPLWVLGYPDRAAERARETLALARSQRQPMTLVFALLVAQGVHLVRGEAAEALAMGDEVIALCREYEFPQEREWSRSFQGAALAALGRIDEGIAQLLDSLAVQRAIGAGLVRSAFLGVLGDLLRFAGRLDEGLRAVDAGFAHAETTAEGGYLAELHRARAELLRATGDTELAEQSFVAAIDYARSQQAKSFELRAATGYANLLIAANRPAEARALLAPIYAWFTEGFETADLTAARSILGEVEAI